MSNTPLIKQLIEFGLSEKEATAYLTLLELEIATVTELAENSGIKRSSMYVVLEGLKRKGLVSFSEDKKVQQFIAISPEMLLLEAENKFNKAEDIKNKIHGLVPELKALHKDTKQKPKIKVFEGKQGVLAALEDSHNCREKTIRLYASEKSLLGNEKDFEAYSENFIKQRIKKGITLYGIYPDTELSQKLTSTYVNKLNKPILIPKNKYQFPADMAIYDDSIGYITPDKKGFALIIESKEIAEVMKNVFDLAYQEAKRLHKINTLVSNYKESITRYTSKT